MGGLYKASIANETVFLAPSKLGPGKISMLPTKWDELRGLTCRSAGLRYGLNPYAPHASTYGLGMERRHENGGKGA